MPKSWKMRLLAAAFAVISVFSATAAGCQQNCPAGTVYDADDGECEQIEQDDD